MNVQWQTLSARMAALSGRERALILLVCLALIGLPLYSFWLEPLALSLQQQQREAERIQQASILLQQQNEALQQALLQDPNLKLRDQLVLARQQITALDTQLQSQMVDLIPASRMPALLQSMLGHSSHLTLQELTSLAPEPLMDGDKALPLYQHGIRMRLKGRYFDLLQYLRALEGLPGHFYWKTLDYQVDHYPEANIELELYTLSDSKEFIRG